MKNNSNKYNLVAQIEQLGAQAYEYLHITSETERCFLRSAPKTIYL
ncbi:MAG: hypothetical protein UW39_C0007G0007 [Parcubacteria group bacterium GW2011_GWC2_44_17]|nr:MAG: hypothetical protein UW39_C0007G0007 [Parcubacteria group bacterium GW2011_GWC2_44_17]